MTRPPKKSLGQNFLSDARVIARISHAGDIAGKTVVEIGPGKGAITEKLLDTATLVIAIETDPHLVAQLNEHFADAIAAGKLYVLHRDMRTFNLEELRTYTDTYTIVANIPYYLSGFILRTCLSASFQPQEMVLLLQQEVGERIVAQDGKESLLSLSVAAYGSAEVVSRVSRHAFTPQPAVDSVILRITNISKTRFDTISEEQFFSILKAAFSQKRKQIARTLAAYAPPETMRNLLRARDYPATARPEEIGIDDWIYIVGKISYNETRHVAAD